MRPSGAPFFLDIYRFIMYNVSWWLIIGKDKMVLEGKIFVPFCLKALIYASISAFLGFKETKILLPTKLLRT